MMTEVQKRFVELEKRKESIKAYFEELKVATEALAAEVGINGYFQDDEGICYKVVIPTGRYVNYETLSYHRTRRPGEKAGDLSMKEAREAGFKVEGQ